MSARLVNRDVCRADPSLTEFCRTKKLFNYMSVYIFIVISGIHGALILVFDD